MSDTAQAFGASLSPHGRGILTAKTRGLLAGSVMIARETPNYSGENGDTGKLHGPRESERDCGCGWGMFCDGPGLCECRRLRDIRASLRVSA